MNATPAIVLGINPNGLGLVKSLVAGGVPVIAVDRAPSSPADTHVWMSSQTRLCRRVLVPPDASHEQLVDALLALADEFCGPLPVLPSGDHFVYLLAHARNRLAPALRFHLPDDETLDLLMKTGRFQQFCKDHEIVTPATATAVTPDSLPEAVQGFRYPLIVKPELRDARWDHRYAPVKALEARDEPSLRAHVADAAHTGAALLVQEIIPGPDCELYFSHGYFAEGGRAVALWTGRKLRQYPPRFGTSTLTETVWVPEIARATERVARALGYRGYLSIEFKRDARDNTYRLIEATPGRTWYPHLLGLAVGVNLPLHWYRDLVGQALPEKRHAPPPDHVAWVDEYRDFHAAFEAWQRGELTLSSWIESYLGVRSFALFSLRDPLPGLFVVARLVMSALGKLRPTRWAAYRTTADATSDTVAKLQPRPRQ